MPEFIVEIFQIKNIYTLSVFKTENSTNNNLGVLERKPILNRGIAQNRYLQLCLSRDRGIAVTCRCQNDFLCDNLILVAILNTA